MSDLINNIKESVDLIRSKGISKPELGIVLGTGLGNLANEIESTHEISYDDLPNFPKSTVQSHEGKLIFGQLSGKNVVAMQGRFHFYEGYNMKEVTFPIRVMKELGIKSLILSNAAGGVNSEMEIGDIMFIEDHINLQPQNPLTGENYEALGPRFPDMSEPYDSELIQKAKFIASKHEVRHLSGVYLSLQGPNLETKAEYKFMHIIGADAIGMSTVPEVIVANHAGLKVFAVSVISNVCYPPEKVVEVTVDEIIKAVSEVEPKLSLIIKDLVEVM